MPGARMVSCCITAACKLEENIYKPLHLLYQGCVMRG